MDVNKAFPSREDEKSAEEGVEEGEEKKMYP